MSITLGTVSSPVVNGRCAGCGRFISRSESHFHSPPRKFPGPPRAHLWVEGGGMVTRCDDVEVARRRIIPKYLRDEFGSLVEDEDRADADALFRASQARVERGRVVPCDCGECSWRWMPFPPDRQNAKGPGITTAVVWYPSMF